MKSEQKHLLLFGISIIITMSMVGIAEILNKGELIFPEIAALCAGAIIAPGKTWNSDKYTSWGLMCFSSLIGIIIVRYAHFPLTIQCIVTFALIVALLLITGSEFYPAISAGVLPVLTHTGSLYYFASVCVFSLLVFVCEFILQKYNLKEQYTVVKKPLTREKLVRFVCLIIFYAIFACFALAYDEIFLIIPPLIVAFVEMSNKDGKAYKKSFDIWLILSIAGGLGFLLNFMINSLGWSHFICTLIVVLVMYIIMYASKLIFPPAGAICLLPYILPAKNIYRYPLEVMIGGAVFIIAARLISKYTDKLNNNESDPTNNAVDQI